MRKRVSVKGLPLWACFGLVTTIGLVGCEENNEELEEFCLEAGLEYREKDGKGYCYEKDVENIDPADVNCAKAQDGDACDDANACTYNDVCDGDTCVGTAIDGIDDGNPCTADSCDPTTGVISYSTEQMDNESCDDQDVCSANDTCQQGVCSGDFSVDANGDPVDDGDACTHNRCGANGVRDNTPYTAQEAATLGLGNVTLQDLANPCAQYVCQVGASDTPHMDALDGNSCADPAAGRSDADCSAWVCLTGLCAVTTTTLHGQSCDDGDVCSSNDVCQDGHCVGDYTVDINGDPVDDGDACTHDRCDTGGVRDNSPISAEEAATLGLGGITLAEVSNPCMAFTCQVGAGDSPHMETLDAVSCADSAAGRSDGECVSWICQTGVCAAAINEEVVASAQVSGGLELHPSCRMRECNTQTGQVLYVPDPRTLDLRCDDANTCTYDDACGIEGQCSGRELAHGTSCQDGNPCTLGDYCHERVCRSGIDYIALANEQPDLQLPDQYDEYRDPAGILAEGDPCRVYACDPVLGVVVQDLTGPVCDDANPCTAASSCRAGECVGVYDATNDGNVCGDSDNPCHQGSCDKGVCINEQVVTDSRSCDPGEAGQGSCRLWICDGSGQCVEDAADTTQNGEVCQLAQPSNNPCEAGICSDGDCQPDLSYLAGQPCNGSFDARCNVGACDDQGRCATTPTSTPDCVLNPEASAADLPCQAGVCQFDDSNTFVCRPLETDGIECDDGNPCNGVDHCQQGSCVERFVSQDVTDPAPGTGECEPPNCFDNLMPTAGGAQLCEVDGDPETVGTCKYTGQCVEISQVVDDVNDCTVPTWNELTGQLVLLHRENGQACHVVNINTCVENLGVCIDGECHTNPMPDGTACNETALAVPSEEDLPAGHDSSCYAEVCIAGECVIDTGLQDGFRCDDGETTCTQHGSCQAGACVASDSARGYGDSCTPDGVTMFITPDGQPVAAKDVECWARTECSEVGTCTVVADRVQDNTPCDFSQDGDNCDGQCLQGLCVAHQWQQQHNAHYCPAPANTCGTVQGCGAEPGQFGDCLYGSVEDGATTAGCQGVDAVNPCLALSCEGGTCSGQPLDGPVDGCSGPAETDPCGEYSCVQGTCDVVPVSVNAMVSCTADENPCTIDRCVLEDPRNVNGPVVCRALLPEAGMVLGCDLDQNPCTVDRCQIVNPGQPHATAECVAQEYANPGTPCGANGLEDDDCMRGECQGRGANVTCELVAEPVGAACVGDPDNTCVTSWACGGDEVGNGQCEPDSSKSDGAACDSNQQPCDEACLDIDGPGPAISSCVNFDDHIGLLSAATLARDEEEQELCRTVYDPTFDPESGDGHTCARFLCYYGDCRPWDSNLPDGLFSSDPNYGGGRTAQGGGNPTNGNSCGDSGECTASGRCVDNVCTGYHHLPDGTRCGSLSCDPDSNQMQTYTCEAGACVERAKPLGSCDMGIANCLSNQCSGGECPKDCLPYNFDYINVFEDISLTGTPLSTQLVSPYDTHTSCPPPDEVPVPLTENQRLACDEGSVLLDLLAFTQIDLPPWWQPPGFEFFNRRYRWLSISANGTVMFHKSRPATAWPLDETLFISGQVGGVEFDPDALDQAGDPINNGDTAARIEVFRDDLSLVTDITAEPPQDPMDQTPYGSFERVGEIFIKAMPGPDGDFDFPADDYVIVQWDQVAFYGCADGSGEQSTMTFQMKWWPLSGHIVFAYPADRNNDGLLSTSLGCLPGRVNGADAVLGLFDEDNVPSQVIGNNGWLIHNNSGPASDSFDGYYVMWPLDRPTTGFAVRGQEWFVDITEYDDETGTTVGTKLEQVSSCDDCCERVDLEQPILIDGVPRQHMYVCADGYLHFLDPDDPYFVAGSIDCQYDTMNDFGPPMFHAAPFWSRLYPWMNPHSGIYWRDDNSGGQRRIIVQWDRVEFPFRGGATSQSSPMVDPQDKEVGEEMCSNRGSEMQDDDRDGAVDCDDTSCACAVACGGRGCGLTFEAIIHVGLGLVEFRYQNSEAEFGYAVASVRDEGFYAGAAIGFQQGGLSMVSFGGGIDLMDGHSGGDFIDEGLRLDDADVDEQWPGQQRNILLWHNGVLVEYPIGWGGISGP